MKKYLFITVLICCATLSCFAQTKEEEARVLYQKGEELYEDTHAGSLPPEKKAEQYYKALSYMEKVDNLIGMTLKTLYLRIVLYDVALKTWPTELDLNNLGTHNNYKALMGMIEQMFKSINKATYPPEKYATLLKIKVETQERLDLFAADDLKRKNFYESLVRREPVFLRDTFDVYMAKFVSEFNADHIRWMENGLAKENKKFAKNGGKFTYRLEYKPANRMLYMFDYNKDQPKTEPYVLADSVYALSFMKISGPKEYPNIADSLVFVHPKKQVNKKIAFSKYIGYEKLYFFPSPKIIYELIAIMENTSFREYFWYKNEQAAN